MEMQSLDDLKKENAGEIAEQQNEQKKEDIAQEDTQQDAQGDIVDEKTDDPADEGDGEKADDPDWMKAEAAEDDKEAKYTDSDAAAIRRKWKGKVTEKEAENEELKKKVEELEKLVKTTSTSQAVLKDKPKRADFDNDDDFLEALTDYKIQLVKEQDKSETTASERKRNFDAHQEKIGKDVDGHYLRAHKLAEKSGITAEAYQAADLKVRSAIESVFPKAGDKVTDALISSLGEGSEKVFYHLGVNQVKRDRLVQLFREDTTGIKAAAYLGQLNAQLNAPIKRETKAPDPIDEVHGDKAGGKDNAGKLREQYKKAHAEGDNQKAFNLKKKAKALKLDTSNW